MGYYTTLERTICKIMISNSIFFMYPPITKEDPFQDLLLPILNEKNNDAMLSLNIILSWNYFDFFELSSISSKKFFIL